MAELSDSQAATSTGLSSILRTTMSTLRMNTVSESAVITVESPAFASTLAPALAVGRWAETASAMRPRPAPGPAPSATHAASPSAITGMSAFIGSPWNSSSSSCGDFRNLSAGTRRAPDVASRQVVQGDTPQRVAP